MNPNLLDGLRASEHPAERKPILLLRDTKGVDTPEINIAVNNDGSVACLCGRIDIDSSPAVRERLLSLLHSAPKILSIDFSAVTHIDSSGIATLIEALRMARGNKTELRLQGLRDRILELFEFTGILSLFNGSTNSSHPGYKAV